VLTSSEKKAFKLHFLYSIIEGYILGVLALNEYVFIKSLKGSNVQVGLLFQFSVMVLIFSIFFNEGIKRIKNKKKLVVVTGLITRLPLLFLLLFPAEHITGSINPVYHYIFLALFLLFYFSNPIIYPIINLFLKSSFSHQNFGRLYSYSTTANKITMLAVTFIYGILLDYSEHTYRYVFASVAFLGVISCYLLASIDYEEKGELLPYKNVFDSVRKTIAGMKDIMKKNKAFADFEAGFMFYGFAFMGTVSVITIFFERALHLNYSSVAYYKNVYNILAILILPYFGRLIGKIDPRKFAAISFGSFLLYLLFTALTQFWPAYVTLAGIKLYYSLNIAAFFNGIFAATMALLWSIGSSYFCRNEDVGDYQSIHLTFTGVRSFFAPLLGVLFYEIFGFAVTFIIGIGFLIIAVFTVIRSQKRESLPVLPHEIPDIVEINTKG